MASPSSPLTVDEAHALILKGKAPANLKVDGSLNFARNPDLKTLPAGLSCYSLDVSDTPIRELPVDLDVTCSLNISGCRKLEKLPDGLKTGSLIMQGLSQLESLPNRLDVWFLDARGCISLEHWPNSAVVQSGGLNLSGCRSLATFPAHLVELATLDISGCRQFTTIPSTLSISHWIDVADSGLTALPANCSGVTIRWKGVPVTEQIAFHPEQLTCKNILAERNAERRRVMIERFGFERFMREAGGSVLDSDQDTGGKRELLHLPLPGDEDIVCLSCFCPSTKRHYLLRVPPKMKTCHAAAAWMAGFDDPAKYKPVIET